MFQAMLYENYIPLKDRGVEHSSSIKFLKREFKSCNLAQRLSSYILRKNPTVPRSTKKI